MYGAPGAVVVAVVVRVSSGVGVSKLDTVTLGKLLAEADTNADDRLASDISYRKKTHL